MHVAWGRRAAFTCLLHFLVSILSAWKQSFAAEAEPALGIDGHQFDFKGVTDLEEVFDFLDTVGIEL